MCRYIGTTFSADQVKYRRTDDSLLLTADATKLVANNSEVIYVLTSCMVIHVDDSSLIIHSMLQ
jgi:hypothetical protein